MKHQHSIHQGYAAPLGFSYIQEANRCWGNFALFSAAADAVELCLFTNGQETRYPMKQSGNIWHLALENIALGQAYGFRIYGKSGSLANPQKIMLDPYGRGVSHKPDLSQPEIYQACLLSNREDNSRFAPKSLVVDESFDWQEDQMPQTPWAQTLIYELHVKGFSKANPKIPEAIRGTYAALSHPENIAYFKALGITALELLPIQCFFSEARLQQKGLSNYWGYNPIAMFAVEKDYAADPSNPLKEFKTMVRALHQAGIEVILDVVFNHSAESEREFPTFCQRGIDERNYYWFDESGNYLNWTGCGNMLNLSTDVTRQWVLDCLRYWVNECHVDGFRFDLATVLGRDSPMFNPQATLLQEIAQDAVLKNVKLIAEPWDIGAGGYQVGHFPAPFAQWNDRFRDDITRFWLWQSGELGAFAQRLAGSSELFQHQGSPYLSVNFISAHDGFTLRDLVSYNHKHNEANLENNHDGRNENYSYNYGIEGAGENLPAAEQQALQARRLAAQQALLASLLLSNGTPMLLAGDEFAHSQQGNNNAYCQDNELTWLNWQHFNQSLFDFTKQTIALRKRILSLTTDAWWSDSNVAWFNCAGRAMNLSDWHNRESKALQVKLDNEHLFLINAKTEPQSFQLPQGDWECIDGTKQGIQQLDVSGMAFIVLKNKDKHHGVRYEKQSQQI